MVAVWYSIVAFKTQILVEVNNSRATNLGVISQRLIDKIHSNNSKKSFSYEGFNFHYISENSFVFLCVCEADVGIRIPFAFLGDIQNRFFATFGQKVPSPNINYSDSFGRVMQDRMLYFSEDPNSDKINRVKKEIDEVKVVMERNIEKVLDRGEKIEILLSKTEDLSYSSFDFKKNATRVKRKMWWKSKGACIALSVILLVIVGLIIFGVLVSKKIIKL